jgi:hypothetical protein
MSVETVCKIRALAVFHDRLKVFSSQEDRIFCNGDVYQLTNAGFTLI